MARQQALLLLAVSTLGTWTAVTALWPAPPTAPADPAALIVGIDPNVDPWWKLTALPGVGVTKARRIVAYRTRAGRPRPFRSALDLTAVRGIGPATAQRMAQQLRFD